MPMWLLKLRDIVWPAVAAVAFAVIAVVSAVVSPTALALPISFGLASISLAILAQRA